MDSLHCEVQCVNVFSVWCFNCFSHGGLKKKKNEWTRKREHVGKRTREWAMSSGGSNICIHFLSFFFWSGGRRRGAKRKGEVCVCVCVPWRNKREMKVFLEATKKLYTGKRAGKPWMGLKNTDKTWEGRRHVLQWHWAPCLVQRGSQKHRKRRSTKDIMEMMDLLGNIVVVTVGARLVYILGKRPLSFLSSSFENKVCGTDRRSQTVSGCAVDFVVGPTGAPCVALC